MGCNKISSAPIFHANKKKSQKKKNKKKDETRKIYRPCQICRRKYEWKSVIFHKWRWIVFGVHYHELSCWRKKQKTKNFACSLCDVAARFHDPNGIVGLLALAPPWEYPLKTLCKSFTHNFHALRTICVCIEKVPLILIALDDEALITSFHSHSISFFPLFFHLIHFSPVLFCHFIWIVSTWKW